MLLTFIRKKALRQNAFRLLFTDTVLGEYTKPLEKHK